MFNVGGTTTTNYANANQILGNTVFVGLSVILDNTAKDASGNCLAGTPLYGDFTKRDGGANAFVKSSITGATKGVWTVQITTAFANDETIVIGGTTYTKKAAESVDNKQFTGSTAAEQVTSLLKMVSLEGFDVASVSGAADKIGFTQKVADAAGSAPVVSKTGSTGAIGSVTQVETPVTGVSNANCVLLHDVKFDGSNDANAVVLIKGTVQLKRMNSAVEELYTESVLAALAAHGIDAINPTPSVN